MPLIAALCLLFLGPFYAGAQENTLDRDSIPEGLRRPQRGEAPRYPRDTVIGSLQRGDVPDGARRFAAGVMAALTAGNQDAASLSRLGSIARDELFSALETVEPRRYRIGEGREEPDGSCSFLVRFLGRELGIAGELYLRFEPAQPSGPAGEGAAPARAETGGAWVLDDLLLEEARELGAVGEEPLFDLPPYERLF